jgi:hypothetical protein
MLSEKIAIVSPNIPFSENPLGIWYAHLFYFLKKKHIIFTNATTLYTFVAADVKRDSIKCLEIMFRTG